MKYEVDKIKQDVRIAIDQNKTSTSLITAGDIDTLSLEDIIDSKLLTAVRYVETNAPVQLLDAGVTFANQTLTKDGKLNSGSIELPDDYMRLRTFKMSDWSRTVTTAILETDPLYALQRSKISGVRGNTERPVVALAMGANGLTLEYYTSKGTISTATYIPLPKIEKNATSNKDEIDIANKLYDAVIYYTAFLVASTVGDKELATILQSLSNELMT